MIPMDALLNALMAIGLLLTLILIVYLIDRVNSIEKDTRQVMNTLTENSARVATPFMGLAAKNGVHSLEDGREHGSVKFW